VDIYVNPNTPHSIELGTKDYPYRFLNLVALEALLSHNRKSPYPLRINLAENLKHYFFR